MLEVAVSKRGMLCLSPIYLTQICTRKCICIAVFEAVWWEFEDGVQVFTGAVLEIKRRHFAGPLVVVCIVDRIGCFSAGVGVETPTPAKKHRCRSAATTPRYMPCTTPPSPLLSWRTKWTTRTTGTNHAAAWLYALTLSVLGHRKPKKEVSK